METLRRISVYLYFPTSQTGLMRQLEGWDKGRQRFPIFTIHERDQRPDFSPEVTCSTL